jgi:general secretion pathway protein G
MRSIASWLWPIVVLGMLAVMGLGAVALVGCPGGSAKILRVDADLRSISSALKAYKMNAGHYPTTEQGLEALVTQPEGPPQPRRWRQLADEVPRDPWNGIYRYRAFPDGDQRGFEIISMGKDGQFGTPDDYSNLDPKS